MTLWAQGCWQHGARGQWTKVPVSGPLAWLSPLASPALTSGGPALAFILALPQTQALSSPASARSGPTCLLSAACCFPFWPLAFLPEYLPPRP